MLVIYGVLDPNDIPRIRDPEPGTLLCCKFYWVLSGPYDGVGNDGVGTGIRTDVVTVDGFTAKDLRVNGRPLPC